MIEIYETRVQKADGKELLFVRLKFGDEEPSLLASIMEQLTMMNPDVLIVESTRKLLAQPAMALQCSVIMVGDSFLWFKT